MARNALRWLLAVIVTAVAASSAQAQWDIQESHTTASLRGIDSVGGGVAWASGSNGTILRTEDGGHLWQKCATPQGAEKLDFRGIQAFDANTAVVMSSGKGDLSRIYGTTDGCATWKLIATNPDADGFWDAIYATDRQHWTVLGDPVKGSFVVRKTSDAGATWQDEHLPPSAANEGAFAASNSSLAVNDFGHIALFGTGSSEGARLYTDCDSCTDLKQGWSVASMPMLVKGQSAGIFSVAGAGWKDATSKDHRSMVAVGGDYEKPAVAAGNAAWSSDGGKTWHAPATAPHGYRSAVDYDAKARVWITAGPNGTDISHDGGRNWQAVKPGPGEPADTDQNWNAISLPFVVGAKGRIGKWRSTATQR